MAKKQKPWGLSAESLTFLGLFAIIIVCFLLFVPKVASTLFPFKRQMILHDFMSTVKQQKTIEPQKFWEFREFYSPGYYTVSKTGLSQSQIQSVENKVGVTLANTPGTDIFLIFTSPHLSSLEALVTTNSLSDAVTVGNTQKTKILLSTSNETVFTDTQGNTYIIFLKPVSAMQTANGFFDYNDADKALVQGKYWLDITKLDGK